MSKGPKTLRGLVLQHERGIPIRYEMKKLAKEANKYHLAAMEAGKIFLVNVRKSGEALNKAKAIMKHGSWKKWLRDNFDASYKTATNYMRIAKYWNDDYMKEAIQRGIAITSLNDYLKMLRDEKPVKGKKKPRTEEQQKEIDELYNILIGMLRLELENLLDEELKVLRENFDLKFWPKWYREIRETVIGALGYSPYPKYDEEWDDIDYHDSEEDFEQLKNESRILDSFCIAKKGVSSHNQSQVKNPRTKE